MNTRLPSPTFTANDLLAEFRSGSGLQQGHDAGIATPVGRYALATGFHAYFEMKVTLQLAAAENDNDSALYLKLMATFAALGEAAARIAGAQLLEVQADRLHFLIEDDTRSLTGAPAAFQRLLNLSHAIITTAYDRLMPMAGAAWKGCSGAADFGRAVLINSPVGGGSVVSLGNAANRPAKRLDAVPAGALSVPVDLLPRELRGGSAGQWIDIDLKNPTQAVCEFLRFELGRQLNDYLRTVPPLPPTQFTVYSADKRFFDALGSGVGVRPTRVQGFCFRADLDGFSKQVAHAFDRGGDAVRDLTLRFSEVLEFPLAFERAIRSHAIILPWAGDCSTILLLPTFGQSMATERESLPVTAALEWHKAFGAEKKFSESVGGARWALGIAAGDRDEGNEGRMLVADIPALGRTFRIAAGWAAKRAADAYQHSGVVGGDTVITQVDRKHLWRPHAEQFEDLGSFLARATLEELRKADVERARRARVSAPASSPIAAAPLAAPRPYFRG